MSGPYQPSMKTKCTNQDESRQINQMEIFHHFSIRISREEDAQQFSDLGIQLERGPRHLPGSTIASFDISEDALQWHPASNLATRFLITDFVTTKFSEPELKSAEAHCIFGSLVRGYPEPSKAEGFLESSYD